MLLKSMGIVGGGVVGQATARAWLEYCGEVRVYDKDDARKTHCYDATIKSELVVVCLPEMELEDFFLAVDTCSINVIVRSTTPVGTLRRLAKNHYQDMVLHWPEFLTARCSFTDAQVPARNLVGVLTNDREPNPLATFFVKLLQQRFPGSPVHLLTAEESELAKLATNSFFAVKVAYFNEVRSLSDKLGLEWDRVIRAILADGRISPSHTQVPGPDGKRGFGGACLPKDLAHLIGSINEHLGKVWGASDVCYAAQTRNNNIDRVEDSKQGDG